MSDRGMMKWLPYKSLNEQGDFLSKMLKDKAKKPKPLISNDLAEDINRALLAYKGGPSELTYYEEGEIKKDDSGLRRVDLLYKRVYLNDGLVIDLTDVLDFRIEEDLFGEGDEALPTD